MSSADRRRATLSPWAPLLACALLIAAAAPAWADDDKPKAANWTVFLQTGSKLAAAQVNHDKERGTYGILLPSGGRITLPEAAVRKVSRDPGDRVASPAPLIASGGAGLRAGSAPGSIDSTANRPVIRQSALKPQGESLAARTSARSPGTRVGPADARARSAREQALTPKPGSMDKMLRRVNGRASSLRR